MEDAQTTSSEVIRKNPEALHSACSNYVQAESSKRIRRALKAKTRTYADVFHNGDLVFYKRKISKGGEDQGKLSVRKVKLYWFVTESPTMESTYVSW